MTYQHNRHSHQGRPVKFLATFILVTISLCVAIPRPGQGLWLFDDILANHTSSQLPDLSKLSQEFASAIQEQQTAAPEQATKHAQQVTNQQQAGLDGFTIAGIRPSNIATLLNTVSETGFSYFNVHDQCRSRTACDVGFMLYKKLNFIHNWIIRASVRTLVDSNNIYALSWNTGMMGKNCTQVYPSCHQSPLDSLMSFALFSA